MSRRFGREAPRDGEYFISYFPQDRFVNEPTEKSKLTLTCFRHRFLKKGEDNLWHDVGDRTAAEKTSQGLRERSNAEKRQRSELRKALRIRKEDLQEDDSAPAAKRVKSESTAATKAAAASIAASTAAAVMPTLNYVGTNLAVPLSLSMTQVVASGGKKKATGSKAKPSSEGMSELNTAGLPPNATDEHGNILVTDHDILVSINSKRCSFCFSKEG